MDKEKFNQLHDTDKEMVFNEMCKLYNLLVNYPINLRDLQIFTEWVSYMGCYGDSLESRLNGFYPAKWLDDGVDIDKILHYFNEALNFTNTWNRIIHNEKHCKDIADRYYG